MLDAYFKKNCLEAGLDEAGRGCLAGPVFAAAVILPSDFKHPLLRDSKTLTKIQREKLRMEIEKHSIDFSVYQIDEKTIDRINILQASIKAMHMAIKSLKIKPHHLIIDGNYFVPTKNIPYKTIVKGDNKYLSIAAASILAKTYRDEWMMRIHNQFPSYNWEQNKGYGTREHVLAIMENGFTKFHRKSFHIKSLIKPCDSIKADD